MILHPVSDCPQCHGRGFVEREDGPVGCDCLTRMASAAVAEDEARVPVKFRRRSLATFKIACTDAAMSRQLAAALDRAKNYVESFSFEPGPRFESDDPLAAPAVSECNGLLLTGCAGAGKTHLAVGVLRDLIAKSYRGLWWNVNDLFREMRESFNYAGGRGGGGDSAILEEAINADVLVLDDLCSEKGSQYVHDRLYAIVNGRYENLRPLIVTTNLNRDELIDALGPRIVSRLGEMCEHIPMPERDYRLSALQGSGAFAPMRQRDRQRSASARGSL